MLAAVEFMCGVGALAYQLTASVRPNGAKALFLHADHGASIPAPFPAHNYILTACWACDDFSQEAGATLVVPGSHLHNRQPTAEEAKAKEGAIAVECPAGSADPCGTVTGRARSKVSVLCCMRATAVRRYALSTSMIT